MSLSVASLQAVALLLCLFELAPLGSGNIVAAQLSASSDTVPPVTIARDAKPVAQPATNPTADVVCDTLMADYILRGGLIDTSTVDAAIELIASRASRGYWRTVYKHFRDDKANEAQFDPSPNLLRILTKMLYHDGRARWLLSHPDELKQSQWIPSVTLPAEVLDTIIRRAKMADRHQFDAYVVAVVAAYDQRSKPFLLDVLNGTVLGGGNDVADARKANSTEARAPVVIDTDAQFHAAVGLANLGERAGIEWLITTGVGGSIWKVPHMSDRGGNLLESRLQVLSDVTGLPYQPLESWQAWWKTNPIGETFESKSQGRLRYR